MSDAALRLVMAALLSAAVGLEREFTHKAAGLRTHMLVGLGAALFTIVGSILGDTRIAAQVVTGVGLLEAGAIFRDGGSVRGLTTAAGLWSVAAVGVAVGAGYLALASLATGVALVVLFALKPIDDRLHRREELP